jgi:hypothetical protein
VRAGYVYWTEEVAGGRVLRTPAGGGSIDVLGSSAKPYEIAVDEAYVYWSDVDANAVYRAPNAPGGTQAVFAPTDSTPGGIALDAHCVYWVESRGGGGPDDGAVKRAPK